MSQIATFEQAERPPDLAPVLTPRFVDVLRSEWTKLRSLRSTWFTLVAAFVITVGIGVLAAGGAAEEFHTLSAADQASFVPTADAYFIACLIGTFTIAVLGILSFTGEHSTGMIRTSLAAVPRRTMLMAAGTVIRATAGAIVTIFAFALLIRHIVIGALPDFLMDLLADYWPTIAGTSIAIAVGENPDGLDPLGVAFAVFARRDV